MSMLKPRTLKWRLIGLLALGQAVLLMLLLVANVLVANLLWSNGWAEEPPNRIVLYAAKAAVIRDARGQLALEQTPALRQLAKTDPGTWFVVEDPKGGRITRGTPPPEIVRLLPFMRAVETANIGRGSDSAKGITEWVDTRAGRVQIVADARSPISTFAVADGLRAVAPEIFFVVAIMILSTLVVTPLVVRRALAGLSKVAAQAERIEIEHSNVRLSDADVPKEVKPLVSAVNEALDRLDAGYERHKRFLSDAAHELRTPITILRTRLSGLPNSEDRKRLIEDATRLEILAGQLLDLQRLEQSGPPETPMDLVQVARQVVLDLAPLAFDAGYEMAFDSDAPRVLISGDEGAVQRAITNLVQNAIDHGGRGGEIAVHVAAGGAISVCDDGEGISAEAREDVFEPFRRLTQGGRGAGLGLDLVQRTMRLHGGYAEVFSGAKRGACLRLVFDEKAKAFG